MGHRANWSCLHSMQALSYSTRTQHLIQIQKWSCSESRKCYRCIHSRCEVEMVCVQNPFQIRNDQSRMKVIRHSSNDCLLSTRTAQGDNNYSGVLMYSHAIAH